MIQKTLFLLAGMLLAFSTMAQTSSKPVVGNHPVVKETPVLNELAGKVNAAHTEVEKSATGSRSSAASAKANYESALNAYATELQHQLTASQSPNKASLQSEIDLVKKLSSGNTSTPGRK